MGKRLDNAAKNLEKDKLYTLAEASALGLDADDLAQLLRERAAAHRTEGNRP